MNKRKQKRYLYPAILLVFFLLLEIVLHFINYRDPSQRYLEGFSEKSYIERSNDYFIPAKRMAHFFHPWKIPQQKDEGEFRILSVGDSVTWGDGTEQGRPIQSYTERLGEMIKTRIAAKKITLFNLGAKTFSSIRIQHLLEEIEVLKPDLLILQFGNSEFLELNTSLKNASISFFKSPLLIKSIMAKVIPKPEKTLYLERRKANGLAYFLEEEDLFQAQEVKAAVVDFKVRIEKIRDQLEQKNINTLWLIPSANAFYTPFSSHYRLESREDHAGWWFKKAKMLLGQEKFNQARAALEMAMDLDGFPLRMLKSMKMYLLDALDEWHGQWRLDLNEIFYPAQIQNFNSKKLFVDHCHFTNYGHQLVAEKIFSALEEKTFQLTPSE